jgi:hypothetical protein
MLIQMPAGAILVVRSGDDVRRVAAAVRRLERVAPPVVGTVITYEPRVENVDHSPQAIVRRFLAAA